MMETIDSQVVSYNYPFAWLVELFVEHQLNRRLIVVEAFRADALVEVVSESIK